MNFDGGKHNNDDAATGRRKLRNEKNMLELEINESFHFNHFDLKIRIVCARMRQQTKCVLRKCLLMMRFNAVKFEYRKRMKKRDEEETEYNEQRKRSCFFIMIFLFFYSFSFLCPIFLCFVRFFSLFYRCSWKLIVRPFLRSFCSTKSDRIVVQSYIFLRCRLSCQYFWIFCFQSWNKSQFSISFFYFILFISFLGRTFFILASTIVDLGIAHSQSQHLFVLFRVFLNVFGRCIFLVDLKMQNEKKKQNPQTQQNAPKYNTNKPSEQSNSKIELNLKMKSIYFLLTDSIRSFSFWLHLILVVIVVVCVCSIQWFCLLWQQVDILSSIVNKNVDKYVYFVAFSHFVPSSEIVWIRRETILLEKSSILLSSQTESSSASLSLSVSPVRINEWAEMRWASLFFMFRYFVGIE